MEMLLASARVGKNWHNPPAGHVKLNTDGAFAAGILCTDATGVVIRREDGSFLAASARRLVQVASALATEAEALRDGVQLVPQGIDRVIAETDSLELVSL
jgi:hypothetical protein